MASVYPAETNTGVVTTWIPLTTVWPMPSGCRDSFRINGPLLVAYDPAYGLDIDPAVTTCQPPAVTTWWLQDRFGYGNGPGQTSVGILPLTCPESFTTAATSIKNQSSVLATCCPLGYHQTYGIVSNVVVICTSDVESGQILTYASTSVYMSSTWPVMITTSLTQASTVAALAVIGWNVDHASLMSTSTSDLTTTSTSASTTTTSTSASTTTTSTSTSASATTSATSSFISPTALPTSSTTPSNGISGGMVGIFTGVSLGMIGSIALILAIFLLRRRKKKSSKANGATEISPGTLIQNHPSTHELSTEGVMAELNGNHRPMSPVELEGDH